MINKCKMLLQCFGSIICLLCSVFIRRKKEYIAFGAWCGKQYSDNSRYIMETFLSISNDKYKFIWIGDSSLKNDLPHDNRVILLSKNSFKSIFYLLKCKYMFCSNMNFEDLCSYNIYCGACVTYLHHGHPIKKWGKDALGSNENSDIRKVINKINAVDLHYAYFVVSSKTQATNFLTALSDKGCNVNNTLQTGTPRNDILVNHSEKDIYRLKTYYSRILGFDSSKKIVLYLPTFRRTGIPTESLFNRKNKQECNKINNFLKEYNAILIEKAHFAEDNQSASIMNIEKENNYIHLTKRTNVQELLLIADILISDYSGAFVDYLLLDRPIVHYIYDYDFYKNIDSGLYYDIDEFASGATAYSYDDLIQELIYIANGADQYKEVRKAKRKFFLEYEKGDASNKIINAIIKK